VPEVKDQRGGTAHDRGGRCKTPEGSRGIAMTLQERASTSPDLVRFKNVTEEQGNGVGKQRRVNNEGDRTMKKSGSLLVAVCVAGSFCLAPLAVAETAAPAGGVVAAAAVQVTATVVKIDQKTRKVTLQAADGRKETFVVDKAVKNLEQVKKGDIVVATYAEALVYEVKKGGGATPAAGAAVGAATAKPGEKPAAVVTRERTVTVAVTAIDEKVPSVSFKGPKGNTRTIKVKDPAKLKNVKVGDSVELTYTEALALSIEKAPAKK
jgi:Cu/Ag efflux protein CusF